MGATGSHMKMQLVFRCLMRCLICRNSESKGAWKWDAGRGGAWMWQLMLGQPRSPVPEHISVGALVSPPCL